MSDPIAAAVDTTRQAAQQRMFDASQQTVEQSTTRLSSSLAAIGNYNRIFSM